MKIKALNPLVLMLAVLTASGAIAKYIDISREKVVDLKNITEVSPGIHVIEDKQHIFLVPNITIIVGREAALIVDTGLGIESAKKVLQEARRLAGDRKLYLTVTHFHPEHGFGAQVFKGQATIIYNRVQRDELLKKEAPFKALFAEKLGVAAAINEVSLATPDIVYDTEAQIDLGGRIVKLNYYYPAHTLGDQVVSIPAQGVVILGDLLETQSFPIMPWFPELSDTDVNPANWREIFRKVAATHPAIIIPGHGHIGTIADLEETAHHMDFVNKAVTEQCAAGNDLPAIQQDLTPTLIAQHPEWDLKEMIGMEIQAYYERLCR